MTEYIYIYEVHAIGEHGGNFTIARFTNAKLAVEWIERFKDKWEHIWLEQQTVFRKNPF